MKLLSLIWKRWLKIAETLGNIQMTILLTAIYFTILAVIAIPYKVFADPLALRSADRASWVRRIQVSRVLDSMKKQG